MTKIVARIITDERKDINAAMIKTGLLPFEQYYRLSLLLL